MVCTTVFNGKENAPTGDDELDALLAEARNLSGKNWQCDKANHYRKRLFRKREISYTHYSLLVFVDGVLPWQYLSCASGSLLRVKAFLYGYINGLKAEPLPIQDYLEVEDE